MQRLLRTASNRVCPTMFITGTPPEENDVADHEDRRVMNTPGCCVLTVSCDLRCLVNTKNAFKISRIFPVLPSIGRHVKLVKPCATPAQPRHNKSGRIPWKITLQRQCIVRAKIVSDSTAISAVRRSGLEGARDSWGKIGERNEAKAAEQVAHWQKLPQLR